MVYTDHKEIHIKNLEVSVPRSKPTQKIENKSIEWGGLDDQSRIRSDEHDLYEYKDDYSMYKTLSKLGKRSEILYKGLTVDRVLALTLVFEGHMPKDVANKYDLLSKGSFTYIRVCLI